MFQCKDLRRNSGSSKCTFVPQSARRIFYSLLKFITLGEIFSMSHICFRALDTHEFRSSWKVEQRIFNWQSCIESACFGFFFHFSVHTNGTTLPGNSTWVQICCQPTATTSNHVSLQHVVLLVTLPSKGSMPGLEAAKAVNFSHKRVLFGCLHLHTVFSVEMSSFSRRKGFDVVRVLLWKPFFVPLFHK